MALFREGLSRYQTPLAMIGAKAGDRVLMIGAGDGLLAGEVAAVTGLNGRTLVIDPDPSAQARVEAGGAKAGALIEFQRAPLAMLPVDPGSFDVAVLDGVLGTVAESECAAILSGARHVLRDGGRVIVIEHGRRPGLLGLLPRRSNPGLDANVVLDFLTAARFRASRILADTEGVAYVEGRK